jgi:hypothetical protein
MCVSALPKMKPVVESKGVNLYCPLDGRFAFFNSPYPSHKENTGVDLYPGKEFGCEAQSPVDGVVELIRRVKAPKGRGFEAADHDTVIIIKNDANHETITKLLHVDPFIEVEEKISVGDPIGTTLRSGYYGWGTSAHIHAEVRNPSDPIRARGGYRLNLIEVDYGEPITEFAGSVAYSRPEYTMIETESNCTGIVGSVNGNPAVIEGGIPYYGWLGAHILDPPEEGTIEFMGEPIAEITERFNRSCKGIGENYSFTVDGEVVFGVSLTLSPVNKPLVKIIPRKIGALSLEKDEWVEVELRVA